MQESLEQALAEAQTLDDLARILTILLGGGFSVWSDGTLLRTRVRVDAIAGVKITINPKEHAPPHFHVVGGGTHASLLISDGSLLEGQLEPRHEKLLRWWFVRAQPRLVDIWNKTRPAGCPVGIINEDGSQHASGG
jgi:hypothetical protein